MPMYYVCTGCGDTLPRGMFYTYKDPNNGGTLRRKRCKVCTIRKTEEARRRRLAKEKGTE